jgi:hypothetical protein
LVDVRRVRVAQGYKLYWRGRDRTGGEIIEVPDKEARLIVKLRRGELVDNASKAMAVPEPRPRPVSHEDQGTGYDSGAVGHELQGRALKAEEPAVAETPRRYKRRDMRSEE